MKITKPCDKMNPNILLENCIIEKYSTCPLCKETKPYSIKDCFNYNKRNGVDIMNRISWYGKRNEKEVENKNVFIWLFNDLIHFREKNHRWKIMEFRCYTCGAEWETEPYPADLNNKIDYLELIELGVIKKDEIIDL